MIKLSKLEVDKEYLIVDKNGCNDPAIIKLKVVEKSKVKNKYEVKAKFLNYIYDDREEDVNYYNNEDVIEELTNDDKERLFNIEDMDTALEYLEKAEEQHEIDQLIFRLEHRTPEHEYPDWDGDESIMYYLDNYREEDDDFEYEDGVYNDCGGNSCCGNCILCAEDD